MKTKIIAFLCFGILTLAGCLAHVDPIQTNPLGKTYQDILVLRNMTLPLPEGEWNVVGRGYVRDRDFIQLCLEQDKGNKPHKIIVIKTTSIDYAISRDRAYTGWNPSKLLKRQNLHHVVSHNNSNTYGIDGWYVGHYRPSFGKMKDKPDAIKEAYQHILDNKLLLPGNFIKIGHILKTSRNKTNNMLTYDIFINPEAEGFPPPQNAEWGSSDWHVARIQEDSAKVAYIEKIIEKSKPFHSKLQKAFGTL